jgi:hypothetical protein
MTAQTVQAALARVDARGAHGHLRGGLVLARSISGGLLVVDEWEENLTLATGGLTTDTTSVIPTGCILLGTPCRITTTVTTSTAVKIGTLTTPTLDTTTGTDFGALTAGTTNAGSKGLPVHVTGETLCRVTAVTNNPGAGAVRVNPRYFTNVPPTS